MEMEDCHLQVGLVRKCWLVGDWRRFPLPRHRIGLPRSRTFIGQRRSRDQWWSDSHAEGKTKQELNRHTNRRRPSTAMKSYHTRRRARKTPSEVVWSGSDACVKECESFRAHKRRGARAGISRRERRSSALLAGAFFVTDFSIFPACHAGSNGR